eukprot:296530-Chlamydomonas_euryale.AAC.1
MYGVPASTAAQMFMSSDWLTRAAGGLHGEHSVFRKHWLVYLRGGRGVRGEAEEDGGTDM